MIGIILKALCALTYCVLLISKAASFSAQQTVPFHQFSFAPNNVCIRPSSFYCQNDGKNGTQPNLEFTMRNVPGEGDCMFQAVALAASTSLGLGGNNALLRAVARETREVVAQVLSAKGTLHIEGQRIVRACDLLGSAAKNEQIKEEEYLQLLRNGTLQGGGTELTVLSNVLRRPISIYELVWDGVKLSVDVPEICAVSHMGSFGDIFLDPLLNIPDHAILSGIQEGAYSWHIHILVVDGGGGEKHACVLLPKS
jgi:hypothetical protein